MRNLRAVAMMIGVLVTMAAGQAPTSGLVAFWPFNGDTNKDLSDASGNGLLLQQVAIQPVTPTADRNGVPLSAVCFTGNSLKASDAALPMGSSARTITMWVRCADDAGQREALLSYGTKAIGTEFRIYKEPNANNYGYGLHVTNNVDTATMTFISTSYVDSSSIVTGIWTHIAITYANNLITFYIGGKLIKTDSLKSCNTTSKQLYIGGCYQSDYSTTDNYRGDADDIFIYNRALSPNEIKNVYNASSITKTITYRCATALNKSQTEHYYNIMGRATKSPNLMNGEYFSELSKRITTR